MSWRGVLRDLLEEGWVKELRIESAKQKGQCLDELDRHARDRQYRCTHKKGGTIIAIRSDASIGVALENGTGNSYAVIKHQQMNGDIWVECLRCSRRWKPPIKPAWYEFWKMDQYFADLEEYHKALNFETNNVMSSTIQRKFEDSSGRNASGVIRKLLAAS